MEQRLSPLVFLVAAAVSAVTSDSIAADLGFSFFGGAQCDAPDVQDGESFESSCSIQPLVGTAVSFSAPGPADWRLEGQGQYSRRSFRSTAFATDTNVRADFLELALVGTWPFYRSSSGFRLAAIVGPQLGVLLGAQRRFQDIDQDITDELRSTDFRIVTAIRLSHRRFFVEGGFAWGLTDLDNTNQQQIHSRGVMVKLGITI